MVRWLGFCLISYVFAANASASCQVFQGSRIYKKSVGSLFDFSRIGNYQNPYDVERLVMKMRWRSWEDTAGEMSVGPDQLRFFLRLAAESFLPNEPVPVLDRISDQALIIFRGLGRELGVEGLVAEVWIRRHHLLNE